MDKDVVKYGFALFLIDSNENLVVGGIPRPKASGYNITEKYFIRDGVTYPVCVPVLMKDVKVYHSYNYAYNSGEKLKKRCKYVATFSIETVGVCEDGSVISLEDAKVEVCEDECMAPIIPMQKRLIKVPADLVSDGGKPFVLPNGETTRLYPIGALATALGRGTITVRQWEIAGIIPSSGFKDKRGVNRMYTAEQIALVVKCAERACLSGGRKFKTTNFSRWVKQGFEVLNQHYMTKKEG
jgi:hypothetical protein